MTILVILAIAAFVYWRLYVTNMDVPPGAEKALGPLGRLKFALEHDLPLDRNDIP